MNCPKCKHPRNQGEQECPSCGVIYAKAEAAANRRKITPPTKGVVQHKLFRLTAPDSNSGVFSGVMKVIGGVVLFFAFAAFMALMFPSQYCQPPSPPSQASYPDTSRAVDWLAEHYRKYGPTAGWYVSSVRSGEDGKEITLILNVPKQMATHLIQQGNSMKGHLLNKNIITGICPNQYEKIWEVFEPSQRLHIEVYAPDYGNFTFADCENFSG